MPARPANGDASRRTVIQRQLGHTNLGITSVYLQVLH